MKYSNAILQESKVRYPDRISDYITKDDFDGVQVVFLFMQFSKRNTNHRYFILNLRPSKCS